jgi:putative lipoprotein
MKLAWLFLLISLDPIAVALAEDSGTTGMEVIEGSVWYRERMALPPNAEIHVYLEDVARMDVPSEVIASTSIAPHGGPPWSFALPYDPLRLQEKGRYALRARIEVDGRLLFINTQQVPAFGRKPGLPVEILVSRVGGRTPGAGATDPVPNASLTETHWELTELDHQPAVLGNGKRKLHMVLASDANRVHGFSGCNRFMGSYELRGEQLHFKALASTRMACMEGMALEQQFLDLLGRITRFSLSGNSLSLYGGGDEAPRLRFNAVASE